VKKIMPYSAEPPSMRMRRMNKQEYHEHILRKEAHKQGVTIEFDGNVWSIKGRHVDIKARCLMTVQAKDLRPTCCPKL